MTVALMKKINGLVAGLCVCGGLTLSAHAQVNTVKFMPMGDSVTARGSSPEASYRYWLAMEVQFAVRFIFVFLGNY